MTEAETFDLPPDDPPPENGVAAARPPKEDREPAYSRSDRGRKHAAPRPPTAPPRSFEESNAQGREPNPEKDTWPTKVGPLWLKILDWLPSQKIGDEVATPEDVLIGIDRISGGGQSGGAELEPIDGVAAVGDENESPDRALMRIIDDSYHLPVSDRRSKVTFRARFYWRRGGKGTIKQSETFTRDSPANILKMRMARGQDAREVHTLDPIPNTMSNGQPVPPGVPPELLLELGELRSRVHGKQQAAPVVVPAPAAPPQNVEAQLEVARLQAQLQAEKDKAAERERAEKEKAELQQQIRDLQAARDKDAQEARFAALEAKLNTPPTKSVAQEVVETLKALGIVVPDANGQPTVAAVAGQPYTAPSITPQQQLMDAARTIAEGQKAGETTREVLRKTFGFAEPSTEIVKDEEEKEEPGILDKILKGVGGNLDVIAQGGLAMVGPFADAVLQPGVAATVKGAAAAAQEQLAKKATARPVVSGGQTAGWQSPPKA